MFIETHSDNGKLLTFIKSTNVQVYPCGRRRSTIIDQDTTTDDQYYIPFDPEARLNTEANNRKHSGLNGYTQTYLKDWDEANKLLMFSLGGYLFNIELCTKDSNGTVLNDYGTPAVFGFKVIEILKNTAEALKDNAKTMAEITAAEALLNNITDATEIYANILIEDVHLFSGRQEYFTEVLRNQSKTDTDNPETSLDLLKSNIANATSEVLLASENEPNNYYFSGLSFSTSPLTGQEKTRSVEKITPVRDAAMGKTVTQTQVSLCILEKVKTSAEGETLDVWEWKIHQPALLPKIEHGATDDSIVVTGNALMKSTLDVKEKLTVKNDVQNALIEADLATVTSAEITEKIKTKDFESTNLITAKNIGTDQNKVVNIITKAANIEDTLTAGTVNANDIQQKISEGENASYYDVPVIFLEPKTEDGKTFYQLQISRVNPKN